MIGLKLPRSQPQVGHGLRLADSLIVSEARPKPIARLERVSGEAPDGAQGADSLRSRPWPAEDGRAPPRAVVRDGLVAHAEATGEWTLEVSLDDVLGEKDRQPRHLEAVESHHDQTKSTRSKPGYTDGSVPIALRVHLGALSYGFDWRLSLCAQTVRRLNRQRPAEQRVGFAKQTSLAHQMLSALQRLWPAGVRVSVLFASG